MCAFLRTEMSADVRISIVPVFALAIKPDQANQFVVLTVSALIAPVVPPLWRPINKLYTCSTPQSVFSKRETLEQDRMPYLSICQCRANLASRSEFKSFIVNNLSGVCKGFAK